MTIDLESCVNGSEEAWSDFVRFSAPIVYSAVMRTMTATSGSAGGRQGGDPGGRQGELADSVEDIVQDVYVRLIRNQCRLLRTYDPARASLSTWLTIVARSIAREKMRRKRLPVVPILHDEPMPASSHNGQIPDALNGDLDSSLNGLSARQREVIELLFHGRMSVAEVAARLGVDEQTVRSTKHKALSRLRAAMAGRNAPGPHTDETEHGDDS